MAVLLLLDTLYFVDENDDPLGNVAEHELRIKFQQSLSIAQYGFVLPPFLQIGADPQLA